MLTDGRRFRHPVGLPPRVLLPLVVCVAALASAAAAFAGTPLQTGVFDPIDFPQDPAHYFQHVAAAGATTVVLYVDLASIAPGGVTKPASFDPTNPDDPAWNWSSIDAQVVQAVDAGLTPILCITDVPEWARDHTQTTVTLPSSVWYGKLAEAVAARYSGSDGSLPRVKYFQAWNEPNEGFSLMPQRDSTGTPISPDWYRRMVNAFARGVKIVHADNLVIAGALAPYSSTTGNGVPPLTFMQQFLCMTGMRIRPRPHCLERAHFDIWSMHPYTWGGPTHHATTTGDLALGDLPAMKTLLDQAVASGRVVSDQPMQFWVTEFSWDTNPPDPGALAIDLQARWTSQALYEMWQDGISLVTWFLIRDQPLATSRWQSGLYNLDDSVKQPTFEAFRFPTVAFVQSGGIQLWARTPAGKTGLVTFDQNIGNGVWLPIATVATDANGIATTLLLAPPSTSGTVEAVFNGETSVPFSLTDVPDQYVDPFGE